MKTYTFSSLFIMGRANIRMHSDQASEQAILPIILKQTPLIGCASHFIKGVPLVWRS